MPQNPSASHTGPAEPRPDLHTGSGEALASYSVTGSPAPAGLLDAFDAYETALMANDVEALEARFAPDDVLGAGVPTVRGDKDGLLQGHDVIADFRRGRSAPPTRTLRSVVVQTVDESSALVMAVTEMARGGTGLQTQLWRRSGGRWLVTAAHVSVPPPAVDSTVWRVIGTPLLAPTAADGPVQGLTVAVKDLYAVAGHRVGAGSAAWLAQAPVAEKSATAVQQLTDAGASVTGIARTDEFAYSLAGVNAHYGTPPNPRAPGRISGGSSSGSASAVSLGQADIGLGTDTGGSIRIPASYQGLFGLRTTHGAVSLAGVLLLAESFDTVGWMTRDAQTLRRVGRVLLPGASSEPFDAAVTCAGLNGVADPDVQAALADLLDGWCASELPPLAWGDLDPDVLPGWLAAFQTVQGFEAWSAHGLWIDANWSTLGTDVAGRFRTASRVSAGEAETARGVALEARRSIRSLIGDRVLVLPSASSVAPLVRDAQQGSEEIQRTRMATIRLTCLAGLGGLPAISVPLRTGDGLPRGACLVGPAGSDLRLLDLAVDLAEQGLLAV